MMGYTHAIIGAANALMIAAIMDVGDPNLFIVATAAGALGGVAVDIDVRDQRTNPKVTDAGRTRLAIAGLFAVAVVLDLVLHYGVISVIISRKILSLCGAIGLITVLVVGFFTPHRTFSHSLLFVLISSICVSCIYPTAMMYYVVGAVFHLFLDMLNYPVHGHGIWLFYPIKRRKGIALGLCKAARTGNKVFYYIGLALFLITSAYYIWKIGFTLDIIGPAIVLIYFIVVLFFERRKSEKEQRHIMHMRGEI